MRLKTIVALALLSYLVATCKHDVALPPDKSGNHGTGNGGNPDSFVYTSSCSPDTVYFYNTIEPIILSNCAMSGCHDATSHKEGLDLTTYRGIVNIVQPGNAGNSKLYEVITASGDDRMPPLPNTPLSGADIASIKLWINQGATDNECKGNCDTSLYTYSGAVAPTIATFCNGCHNPNVLNGGIDLSTYNGVRTVALNGKLTGTITHAAGYPPMPQGSTQLSSCQILQIEKWIAAGANNN